MYTKQPYFESDNDWPPGVDLKNKRGTAYSNKEDDLIREAWLVTGVDLFHGTERKGTPF